MAVFLVIAGLTGAFLAFYHELDAAVNPRLYRAPPPAPGAVPLDPLELRERAQALAPGAWVHFVPLSHTAGEAVIFYAEGPTDPATGEHAEIGNDEYFLDPYTGEELGRRKWGDITQGWTNLLPFLYRLHYSLALGTVGSYVFGVVAFLWTLDCFAGAYLTFPPRRRSAPGTRDEAGPRRGWLARWAPAWKVRWRGGPYRLNFDLHRAGSLWVWAMLFVFAWSSVGLNLGEVYNPVMRALFTVQDPYTELPKLPRDQAQPGIPWHEARRIGRELMAQQVAAAGFRVERESRLAYDPHSALYRYVVFSDRDIQDKYGATTVFFDANSGEFRALSLPTGQASGNTVTTWLYALHFGTVFGLPYRIFVSVLGVLVVMVSVTGVYIWLKKRRARSARQRRPAPERAREALAPLR